MYFNFAKGIPWTRAQLATIEIIVTSQIYIYRVRYNARHE